MLLQTNPRLLSHRSGYRSVERWASRRAVATVRAAGRPAEDLSRATTLRKLLDRPGLLLGPACFDGMSARLTERAGFDFAFLSGFSVAAARLGAPDTGLLSFAEVLDQGRNMHEATRHLPIIGDGDTGYGNAVNVKRTVRQYAAAGFAGILIEDQQWPKSCGHVRNKAVVGRGEAVARIRAACDARDEGRDIVIVARTDARQAESLEEAMWRAAAFADAGADVVFVDALESVAEMEALCAIPRVHKMANMLEGGGKTPILTPAQLEAMGFKLCAYPLSLIGVSVRAMELALQGLKAGRVPTEPAMPSFGELQAACGFPEYFAEEERYARFAASVGTNAATSTSTTAASSSAAGASAAAVGATSSAAAAEPAGIEPDAVVEPGSSSSSTSGSSSDARSSATGTIDLALMSSSQDGDGKQSYGRRPAGEREIQFVRIKITDKTDGLVKLDTRFPAGFINSISAFVPAVAGVDLEGLVKRAVGEDWDPSRPVLDDTLTGTDRIQVFLEFS